MRSPSNIPLEKGVCNGPERIVMTATGTVTPQGLSTWGTALGVRFRKTAWCEHETVLLPSDRDGVVLRGATVSRLPADVIPPHLDGAERAAALLVPALNESIRGLLPQQISNLCCRIHNGFADPEGLHHLLQAKCPGLSVQPQQDVAATLSRFGRCAFFESIIGAVEELKKGKAERALVACVDSLCATSWLMKVRDEGVLKDSFTPDGIIAGEAAGAVLLELESVARKRHASILAVITSWGRGTESNSWYEAPPATGRGLTEALDDAVTAFGDGAGAISSVVVDLNGERHRALDWAYAEGRLFSKASREPELRHPAFITGDCGDATGAVLLADAIGRMMFHPQFQSRIALIASDESGARRVIVLEPGDSVCRRDLIGDIRSRIRSKSIDNWGAVICQQR